ncbi:MAG: tripartite tricarboxylate transporter TctB family protein [Oscillospiraceae bacterium]|nr:tripartite tricarboxylate transporter TctB family protein [Oscillospiraceae bacterium]
MKKKISVVREVWLGLFLMAFSGFFLKQCDNINQKAAQYPRIILTILLVFSAALFLQGVWYSFRPEAYREKYGKNMQAVNWNVVFHPLVVFAAAAVYLALFHFTNFFIATAVFVPVIMLIFRERRVLPILLTTVGLELFVYLMFVKLLHVYFKI